MKGNEITIQPVDAVNRETIIALSVDEKQSRFIETNAESLQEMVEDTKYNWQSYAFYDGERPVGFMMVGAENQTERYVWLDRLMMDQNEQGKGVGTKCLRMAVEFIQTQYDVDDIILSLHQENEAAKRFYAKNGFVDSGLIDEWNGEAIWVYHTKTRPS
ncbi:GNAT family N-acetyltransferase [Exiguobacterium sp. B2(2022)]|uniref:GNAT family N-acetyltransferase n=1 Tax=Exiguobacterium sp. B2(2022) TaxID=2992755 RepID=UPI00237C0B50|nr:GNAT family N-acetyltransferase [Exiguobacterium sp. B2(2022)]MDE0563716.1 GNAT family N-acetyltransferase [Exiguobacterium sp. B2(2022)]